MKIFIGLLLPALLLLSACSDFSEARRPDVLAGLPYGGNIVGFNEAGTQLVSGDQHGGIRLWNLPDGSLAMRWRAHEGSVNGLAFLQHDRRLLTAGYDDTLALWDLQGNLLTRITTAAPIMHMVADAAGEHIVTGHQDGSVRIWSGDMQLLSSHPLHHGAVRAVAFDPVTGNVASSGQDGAVFILNPAGKAHQLAPPAADAWTLAFSPDGTLLYGGSWFRLLRWNLATDELTSLTTDHHGLIRSLQFGSGGRYLASISRQTDSAVLFLQPATGKVIERFAKHDLCGAYIAVSPDGHFLATTSDDATVRIWNLEGRSDMKNDPKHDNS